MKINPQVSLSKVKFNEDKDVHLVVSLTAPKIDWQARRLPICLMLVLDISGSMAGPKLEEAKKSARKIVENLKEGDYCGVAVFEDRARLISAPIEINDQNSRILHGKISDIATEGCTNFHDGMMMGLSEVNRKEIPEKMIVRVIMLTDGLANRGISDTSGLLSLLRNNAGRATVSAFGYGTDAAQDFLATFAQEGRGNYAYIKDHKEALSTFAKELGGLLSMYARNIVIEIEGGDNKFELISEVTHNVKNGVTNVRISDIIGEEVRNIVLKCKLHAISQADTIPQSVCKNLAKVTVSFDLLKEDGSTEAMKQVLYPQVEFVNAGEEQTAVAAGLDEIIGRAEMLRAQHEAEEKAKTGNYEGAHRIMTISSNSLRSRGLEKLAFTSNKLGDKMGSEAAYVSSQGYRTSTYTAGTRGIGTSGMDSEAAEDIVLTGESLSNSTQDALIESFVKNVPVSPTTKK